MNVVIRFAGGRFAQLMCTGDVGLDGHAIIAGTGGRLVVLLYFSRKGELKNTFS